MKKILFAVTIFVLKGAALTAQNLVSNYGFETYTTCPNNTGQVIHATGWSSAKNSPDYYNACAGNGTTTGVPGNVCGYQQPATGNGYIGILCYGSFASSLLADNREFAAGTLSQALIPGTTYYVSLKAARMNASSHAVNNIGIKFLMSAPANLPLTNIAQVSSAGVVADTMNWTLITGSFVADSSYTFLCVGNHFTDALTNVDTIAPVTFGYNAYYYIDDVCVSTDPLTCNVPVGLDEALQSPDIRVFPNPFSNEILFSRLNGPSEVILYDIAGKQTLSHILTVAHHTLQTGSLPKGIYIYELRNVDSRVIKKGKVIKN